MSEAAPSESVPIPTLDWNAHKEAIHRLYIEDNGTVHDVQRYLANDHNVHVSISQLKRRVLQLGFRKNVASVQMDQITRELMRTNRRDLEGRCTNKSLTVLGHKVELQRIKRFQRRRLRNKVETDRSTPRSQRQSTDDPSYHSSLLSELSPQPSSPRQIQSAVEDDYHQTTLRDLSISRLIEPRPSIRSSQELSSISSSRLTALTEGESDIGSIQTTSLSERNDDTRKFSTRLACPFHKYDPLEYSEYGKSGRRFQSCISTFEATHRLKQHLIRVHTMSPYTCPRCASVFEDSTTLSDHIQAYIPCDPAPERLSGLMPPGQAREVLKRRMYGQSETENWFRIWDLLFPKQPRPSNPYLGDVLHDTIDHFENLVQALGHCGTSNLLLSSKLPKETRSILGIAFNRIFPESKPQTPSASTPTVSEAETWQNYMSREPEHMDLFPDQIDGDEKSFYLEFECPKCRADWGSCLCKWLFD